MVDGEDVAFIAEAERSFFRTVFRSTHSLVAELLVNTFDQIFNSAIDPSGAIRVGEGELVGPSGRIAIYRALVDSFERHDHDAACRTVDLVLDGVAALVESSTPQPARRGSRRRKTG